MLKAFINALPDKVRSTDDFQYGCKFRKKRKALQHLYVELPQFYKKYIALDIDKPGSAYFWDSVGLPPPTFVIVNPENAHCHYLYELKIPVYYTEQARRAPQKFFEATDIALTNLLGADLGYVGHFIKNPLHPHWRLIHHPVRYDLEDFMEWGVELKGNKNKQCLKESPEGRNTTLFDTLRLWAYQDVLHQSSYEPFQQDVDSKALSLNGAFLDCEKGVLPAKEVLSTAKSVGNWTWRHRSTIGQQKNRGIMQLPADMPKTAKQVAGASYAHANNSAKQSTREAVLQAAIGLKALGIPITQQSVAIRADVSMRTVKNHWNYVDTQVGLYEKK
ncbi:replication initiation protein [Acidovorax sp. SUPP2825]|uniref:replication initiation protein n=1 Tax=Acidovorax sp. SUPP2825 TaxID=2920879 RepID=UPI0023DE452E|nr:replication initiation protein [Acidovorax sp. SUPP2825]GKS97668.1 replication initiation protein [Acidovorax sp. SUPP2825]